MVIDAIFLCFCEDMEINDGSPERRYFASLELQVRFLFNLIAIKYDD